MLLIRRKCTLFFCLLVFSTPFHAAGQALEKYVVYFSDKSCQDFDPFSYFSERTIERRMIQRLPLYDWYDLPVDESYLSGIEHTGATVRMHSRWLNAAVVLATASAVDKIRQFSYVKEVELLPVIELRLAGGLGKFDEDRLSSEDSVVMHRQVNRMGEEQWREKDINGKGIRIAIFDAGFSGADRHPAFEHLRKNNRIILTKDFVSKDESVWHGSTHGTGVWSCIGGIISGQPSGLAWDAEFLLARTENAATEPFSEEENWVAAAEWADKNGADIINSSLGYTDKRYFNHQMDGKSTFVTRGANMAARKGMLVVNAAGNEGNGSWSIISAPADADSVLSVGGVESCCDYHISFSSFGPTWDKRLKPNVCAQGYVVCAELLGSGSSQGTSFASPLVAGFAACAWQYNRGLKNMELFREIEKSGNLYPYFDYAHGYGIPQASRIMGERMTDSSFRIVPNVSEDSLLVEVLAGKFKSPSADVSETGDDEPAGDDYQDLLYYQVMNANGLIDRYYVISVASEKPLGFSKSVYTAGQQIRVFYKGQYEVIRF